METLAIILIVSVIASWLFVPFRCAYIAHSKGRSQRAWFLRGLLFNLFVLLVIGFADKKENE